MQIFVLLLSTYFFYPLPIIIHLDAVLLSTYMFTDHSKAWYQTDYSDFGKSILDKIEDGTRSDSVLKTKIWIMDERLCSDGESEQKSEYLRWREQRLLFLFQLFTLWLFILFCQCQLVCIQYANQQFVLLSTSSRKNTTIIA